MKLRFLGTGASVGVPAFYCNCIGCNEARGEARRQRTRSSLLIEDGEMSILIDASPDLAQQLERERLSRVDALFLTHHHYDHCGGVSELEAYVRLVRGRPIPAWMTAESYQWFANALDYMSDCLAVQEMQAGSQIECGSAKYTAVDVDHAPGTIGVLGESQSGRRFAYIPDSGPLPPRTCETLRGIETLILGATFWGSNLMPETHLSVEQAVNTGLELGVQALYLTHVSMHYEPVTSTKLEEYLRSRGGHLHLAYDGLCIES